MITASEPLEFIPRGRQAVETHPGPSVTHHDGTLPPGDNLLLYRLQNFSISTDESSTEFWHLEELFAEPQNEEQDSRREATNVSNLNFLHTYKVNSEDELYVKGNTAVWSQGLQGDDDQVAPRVCFTCETPIKFAFFCSPSFMESDGSKDEEEAGGKKDKVRGICLIDSTSLRVYRDDGEDFICSLEFQVSNVWNTQHGILLEKEASGMMVQSDTMLPMPRVFSLTHPLDEMSPVLIKSFTGCVSYLTEVDYKLISTDATNNIVLMFDNKIGKHFVCSLRKTTMEEVNAVAGQTFEGSTMNSSHFSGTPFHTGQPGSMYKSAAMYTTKMHQTHLHPNLNTTFWSLSNRPSGSPASWASSTNTPQTRGVSQSPLARLQTSAGQSSTMSLRKLGQAQSSKPIIPEFCLAYLWSEPSNPKTEFIECASKGFLHTDLVGQLYLCYLLPRNAKLILVPLVRTKESEFHFFGKSSAISAKDAIVLNRMNMITVLAPCGTIMLYSGPVQVGKVHVGGVLSSFALIERLESFNFPRRSSLLPTAPPESQIEDELNMFSPVHPHCAAANIAKNTVGSTCIGLRDPSGNRLTLIYAGGKLFRITLPQICENILVARCLLTLRQVLQSDLAIQVMVKWYGMKNAPGTTNMTPNKEWKMFKNMLLEMLGRSSSSPDASSSSQSNLSSEEPKKRRKNDNSNGADSDWEYLQQMRRDSTFLGRGGIPSSNVRESMKNDTSTLLFSHIPLILFSLHLLYEDLKLSLSTQQYLQPMAEFLYQLAMDLNLDQYCLHYYLDFPHLAQKISTSYLTETDLTSLQNLNLIISTEIPRIYKGVYDILRMEGVGCVEAYPYVGRINIMSRKVIKAITYFHLGERAVKKCVKEYIPATGKMVPDEAGVSLKSGIGMSREEISQLPPAINFVIIHFLGRYKSNPPLGCDTESYRLLLRSDLVSHASYGQENRKIMDSKKYANEHSLSPRIALSPSMNGKNERSMDEDGMEEIDSKLFCLRFPDDLRVHEVRRLLNSAYPVTIDIVQGPSVTDHDFIEEKEKQLFALCTRTMALPLGRGMFTLRTTNPTSTKSLPIPKLCLTGKEVLKGATIELQQIEVPPNMNCWPLFHNGVAAGLRITPQAKDIDSTWIVYNKPKGSSDVSIEHAGLLMALGLNGHLKSLSFMSIYDYLLKCDEMTSIGLLLGISAAHRKTMNMTITKLLSVHIEALLPPTALELDIQQNIQVATLMGVGLVYEGTAKRHMAEILLQEIGRPPGPEMENCVERESYALTAGLALGLVTLGQGETPTGLRDLELPDTLHYYMIGGNKRALTGAQREKYKLPSFQIREGDTVNIDVTAPGATLALGLMFLQTGNQAVANWMMPPDTRYLLDFVRPDLLMLRMISRGLILWHTVEPTKEWLEQQFPQSLRFDLKRGPKVSENVDIDHEAHCQAYCNIITGAAFCMGLRYAGTENPTAYKTLKDLVKMFLSVGGQYLGEYAGKATVESCLIMVVLSMSLIFAGSGNLNILRIIRLLRTRIGATNSHVTYGSHMALHMALGFLFLGAGRYTLSTSPSAIAALVCSLFPKFPTHSNDNRYHLQAFRHLYVLAIEARLLLPRDVDTGKLSLCNLACVKLGSSELIQLPLAPCILPELKTLQAVIVNDLYYWPVRFARDSNWHQLEKILEKCGCVDIKKRAGCLSLLEDPNRLKSLLAKSLTSEQFSTWRIKPKNLLSFSSDTFVEIFVEKLLLGQEDVATCDQEQELTELLMTQFYNCLIQDRLEALPIFVALLMILKRINLRPSTQDIWQFKIIGAILRRTSSNSPQESLLSREILQSLELKLMACIETWSNDCSNLMKQFLFSSNINFLQDGNLSTVTLTKLAILVVFYDLPINVLNFVDLRSQLNYLGMLVELKKLKLDTHSIHCISKILLNSV
ncbi:Anaphase-promoting complex subunit 1 [Sergentomyia squamirostris]